MHLFRVARLTLHRSTRYPADKDEAVQKDRAASARRTEYPAVHFSTRVSRRILPCPSRPTTAKKEVKRTREGEGAQAVAIGNPTAPRPMPRRLYRFTTERRTSVNRYLLTLDFPWPPPRTRSRFPFLLLSPSQPQSLRQPFFPSRRVSFSRILLRGSVSSAFLLPTFRLSSAATLRAVGRRGVRAADRG